jgi:hypothetical protein
VPGTGIVQILKDKEIVQELPVSADNPKVIFNKLEPGTYNLRYIEDINKNVEWDTGNYLARKQPERVIYLGAQISIRESWDQEIVWDFKPDAGRSKKSR